MAGRARARKRGARAAPQANAAAQAHPASTAIASRVRTSKRSTLPSRLKMGRRPSRAKGSGIVTPGEDAPAGDLQRGAHGEQGGAHRQQRPERGVAAPADDRQAGQGEDQGDQAQAEIAGHDGGIQPAPPGGRLAEPGVVGRGQDEAEQIGGVDALLAGGLRGDALGLRAAPGAEGIGAAEQQRRDAEGQRQPRQPRRAGPRPGAPRRPVGPAGGATSRS